MDAPQNSNPPPKREMHPLRIILVIVLAVLTFPLLVHGLFVTALLLLTMPNGFD